MKITMTLELEIADLPAEDLDVIEEQLGERPTADDTVVVEAFAKQLARVLRNRELMREHLWAGSDMAGEISAALCIDARGDRMSTARPIGNIPDGQLAFMAARIDGDFGAQYSIRNLIVRRSGTGFLAEFDCIPKNRSMASWHRVAYFDPPSGEGFAPDLSWCNMAGPA